MNKMILAGVLALAACTTNPETGKKEFDPDVSFALRQTTISILDGYRRSGLDLKLMNDQQRAIALGTCPALPAVISLWRPDAPEVGAELMAWCLVIMDAAGENTVEETGS